MVVGLWGTGKELKNHSMGNTGFNRVKSAFQHLQTEHIPKGELWLGADILKKADLEDNLEGRLHLVKRLKHDMICLSTAREECKNVCKNGVKSFLLTNCIVLLILAHGKTPKNPISRSLLPCHLPWK